MEDVVKLKSARSSPAGGPWESLRHNRPYWFLIASDLISQSGDHFRLITVTVFTFQLSGSILATALQLVFASLPGFLFSHVAGRLADRYPVRTSLVVLSIISAIGTLFYIIAPNALAIFALNFCMATLRVTAGPIRGAWLPQIVKNEQVSAANGIRASAGGIVDLLFPILAGIVVAAFGTKAGFLVDSLSFLLAAIGFLMVSAPRATSISSQPSTGSETPDLGDANDPEARPIIVPTSGWEFVIS